jgi:hypothetical protein
VDHPELYSETGCPDVVFAALSALATPFSAGFLGARSDAAASLATAKAAFVDAISRIDAAFTAVLARTGSDFTLSAGSPIPGIQSSWPTVQNGIRFEKVLM